jgi:integrase
MTATRAYADPSACRRASGAQFAQASHTWAKAREAAGAPATKENGIHVLRHTAASAWLAGGVDIRTLADWLGLLTRASPSGRTHT